MFTPSLSNGARMHSSIAMGAKRSKKKVKNNTVSSPSTPQLNILCSCTVMVRTFLETEGYTTYQGYRSAVNTDNTTARGQYLAVPNDLSGREELTISLTMVNATIQISVRAAGNPEVKTYPVSPAFAKSVNQNCDEYVSILNKLIDTVLPSLGIIVIYRKSQGEDIPDNWTSLTKIDILSIFKLFVLNRDNVQKAIATIAQVLQIDAPTVDSYGRLTAKDQYGFHSAWTQAHCNTNQVNKMVSNSAIRGLLIFRLLQGNRAGLDVLSGLLEEYDTYLSNIPTTRKSSGGADNQSLSAEIIKLDTKLTSIDAKLSNLSDIVSEFIAEYKTGPEPQDNGGAVTGSATN